MPLSKDTHESLWPTLPHIVKLRKRLTYHYSNLFQVMNIYTALVIKLPFEWGFIYYDWWLRLLRRHRILAWWFRKIICLWEFDEHLFQLVIQISGVYFLSFSTLPIDWPTNIIFDMQKIAESNKSKEIGIKTTPKSKVIFVVGNDFLQSILMVMSEPSAR